ncbi:hypothetical protein HDU86_004063 [Geranomyces michiganensis]|nr:hypothetical protein HDU86_004063 [Geranomyces michiganensis]
MQDAPEEPCKIANIVADFITKEQRAKSKSLGSHRILVAIVPPELVKICPELQNTLQIEPVKKLRSLTTCICILKSIDPTLEAEAAAMLLQTGTAGGIAYLQKQTGRSLTLNQDDDVL